MSNAGESLHHQLSHDYILFGNKIDLWHVLEHSAILVMSHVFQARLHGSKHVVGNGDNGIHSGSVVRFAPLAIPIKDA